MTAEPDSQITSVSLETALHNYEHWRTTTARFSSTTWAGEKPGLVAFVAAMQDRGAWTTGNLDAFDLQEWWDCLQGAYQDSTLVTRLAQLRSFLRFCVECRWMRKDPSLLLRAPIPIPKLRDRLDAAQLLDLLEAATFPQHRALLALCTNLGLRSSEIRLLRVGDVNLRAGELKVAVPKTRQAEAMPITTELYAELDRWLRHYEEVCSALTPRSYLVPSMYVSNVEGRITYRPDRMMGKAYPADVVHRALTTIGWEDTRGEGVHTVRRSLARLFFDDVEGSESFDSALLATMSLLHHTRPETTLRYIGRDRATLARDRMLKHKSFLTRVAGRPALRVVG